MVLYFGLSSTGPVQRETAFCVFGVKKVMILRSDIESVLFSHGYRYPDVFVQSMSLTPFKATHVRIMLGEWGTFTLTKNVIEVMTKPFTPLDVLFMRTLRFHLA